MHHPLRIHLGCIRNLPAAVCIASQACQKVQHGNSLALGSHGHCQPGTVCDCLTLHRLCFVVAAAHSGGYETHLLVEWEGGKVNDMVADAVIATLLRATGGSPPGLEAADTLWRAARTAGDKEAAERAELHIIAALMRAQFGPAQVDEETGVIKVQVGAHHASHPLEGLQVSIALHEGKVECADLALSARVDRAVRRMMEALHPVSLDV